MPITRTAWIDDDGSGTTGTIINNAAKQEIYNQIDASCAFVASPNSFTGRPQFLTHVSAPDLTFQETGRPVDQRAFRIVGTGGVLKVDALSDAGAILATPITIGRLGNVVVQGDISEKNRAVPLGHWIDIPFSAANFTSDIGSWTVGTQYTYTYSLIGKTITMALYVNGTIAGNPTRLYVALPAGMISAHQQIGHQAYTGVITGRGEVEILSGANRIGLLVSLAAPAWTNGNLFMGFTLTFSIV